MFCCINKSNKSSMNLEDWCHYSTIENIVLISTFYLFKISVIRELLHRAKKIENY